MAQEIILIDDTRKQIWHTDVPLHLLERYVQQLKDVYIKDYNIINVATEKVIDMDGILLFDVTGSKRKILVMGK